jgi:hypothetical protein
MERVGAGFRDEDVADTDLRETAGIAGEMRVGRGEMANTTARAWDGRTGMTAVSGDCDRQRQGWGRGGVLHKKKWTPTLPYKVVEIWREFRGNRCVR